VSGRDSTGSLSTSYEMEKYLSILSSLTPAGAGIAVPTNSTLSMTLTPGDHRPRYEVSSSSRKTRGMMTMSRLTSHVTSGLTAKSLRGNFFDIVLYRLAHYRPGDFIILASSNKLSVNEEYSDRNLPRILIQNYQEITDEILPE